MGDDKGCGVIIFILLLLTGIFIFPLYDVVYKQGQIDALTGNIKYELVTHPDKTSAWERKK